jgi:penicillin-binding protein 1A
MLRNLFKRRGKRRAKPIRKATAVSRVAKGKGTSKPRLRANARASEGVLRRLLTNRFLWLVALRLGIAGFIITGIAVIYFAQSLPDISQLNTIKKQQGITILTEDGRVIANYGDVYGAYVPYEQLPKTLIQAVIATEDRRFFSHHGIDIFGILRALVTNLRHGYLVQGGSTVTQQLAKNVFLTPDRTISRKLQEVLLAFWLERQYTKKEIMAIYLNRVYLGSGTYGVDAASRRYFNKSASELTLAESALIAGLLKAPSHYSPVASIERSQARLAQVLENMVDAGFINETAIKPTMDSFKQVPAHETAGGEARYFTDWILDQLVEYGGGSPDDLVVTTTMSTSLQAKASDVVQNTVATEGESKRISQGAVVAMTPDGAVKAMVGGVNYGKSQYNRAAQAKRQPGSVFKLFVYLAALESGFTPETLVLDAPVTLQVGNKVWTPANYGNDFKGDIPMVQALRESLNTVSVRLAQAAGIGRVAEMAMRLGVPNIPRHPSIALGSVEATLLEMTGAFAHLPNHGNKVVPYGILMIKTREGKEIYKREAPSDEQLLSDSHVKMMNYMLLDVVRRGTGTRAGLAKRMVAGKTGTSQDFKDAWFIGFTPQLVTGVWVGNDDNKPMKKITGGSVPATIWHDFMTHAMEGLPVENIPSQSTGGGLLPWLFGSNGAAPSQSEVVVEEAPLAPVYSDVPLTGSPATLKGTPAPFGKPSAPLNPSEVTH